MPTWQTDILVLRKTKLGETDLIVTALNEEGRQVRAVAKGARKPGSRVGAHLELYSVARVLLHKGRNLDVVTEAMTQNGNLSCRADLLHSAGAAVIVEMLDAASSAGTGEARLFPLACEALRCVGAVGEEGVALIAAAALIKIAAQLGFGPSLARCACCGQDVKASSTQAARSPGFSFEQGGVLCPACTIELAESGHGGGYPILPAQVAWVEVLLAARFAALEVHADAEHALLGREMLLFSREWVRTHLACRLRSVDYLASLLPDT
jgi:DNA repair protein RecO (recombination protein O)